MMEKAIEAIERHGILLVYPIKHRREPLSLWSVLHPKAKMDWAWDSDADPKIAQMWQLREALARTTDVVYAKWFRRRATFFSRGVYGAMLAEVRKQHPERKLSPAARTLLEILEDDSPQSTKVLKANADMQGRANETMYQKALDELFTFMLAVGAGEEQDGAFPSLRVGATRLLFEDLWEEGGDPEAMHRALEASYPFQRMFDDVFARLLGFQIR
jgi:hypothetical protein